MSNEAFHLLGITNRCVEGSDNFMALKKVAKLMSPDMMLDIFDINEIPFYDPGMENNDMPVSVSHLSNRLKLARGLVIFTPEYNHSVPARIKNCLDWLSRIKPNPLCDLPTMIGSVATGHLGGARVQYELRRVLDSQQAHTLLKPEVFIGDAKSKFNSLGECTDEDTIKMLSLQISSFKHLIEKAHQFDSIMAL